MTASRIAMRRRNRRRGVLATAGASRRPKVLVALAAIVASFTVFTVALFGGAAIFALGEYNNVAGGVGPAEEVIASYSRGGARVLDRNGTLLYQFVDPLTGLRQPVPLDEISDWLVDGSIAVEDPDFWDNAGINIRGTVRAGVENFAPWLIGGDQFFEGTGGSSITQQLARNVYMTAEQRQERSVDRKLTEMVIARELTERYPKDQILEWYLNSISYGGIYTGVQAAAEGYFGKNASELTIAEAALLAGIPQSPAQYNPLSPTNYQNGTLNERGLAKQRQLQVLGLMEERGVITAAEAKQAREDQIAFRQTRYDIEAPHFVLNRIKDEITARFGEKGLYEMGLVVTTTLDLELQQMAQEILEQHIVEYGEPAKLYNGALVAINPRNGQILVYIGSRDYFRDDIEGRNDNATARNSPGSTLKPFTYMTAFMNGWGTGTAILDTPFKIVDFATGGEFEPRNPNNAFQGPITAAKALGNSLNIPAIKTILYAGVPNTISTLKRAGYTTFDNPGGYGPALTTGGSEITLLDQVIGYSVLAAGGIMRGQDVVTYEPRQGERTVEPVALLRVEDADGRIIYQFSEPTEKRVVGAEYAYLVTSILSDGQNTCIVYGVCNALGLPNGYPSAAKTGTSEPFDNSRDIGETWTIGYTPELVAGIWAGNADNAPIPPIITSTSVSFRGWREFMVQAIEHLRLPRTGFQRPAGVVEVEVCWPSGKLPTPNCPQINRYKSLYAQEILPRNPQDRPEMYDSWWQGTAIDVRTGQPATAQTPAQFVRREVRLVLPADEVKGWGGYAAWAASAGIGGYLGGPIGPGGSPTGTDGQLLARIDSPGPGQAVSGVVQVTGRAASPDFQQYRVEWGRGANPTSWASVHTSVAQINGGLLANWDTTALSPGDYTVRVVLQDAQLGERRYQVTVSVGGGGGGGTSPGGGGTAQPTPQPTQAPAEAPLLVISSPPNGARVAGVVSVTGVARSANFVSVAVDVGQGTAPASFQRVAVRSTVALNEVIGTWDTRGFANGPWTIRVVLSDSVHGDIVALIVVVVDNGP